MRESIQYKFFSVLNVLFLIIVMFTALYPFLYVIAVSLSSNQAIIQNKVTFYPIGFNIMAYKGVLENPWIGRAYFNTTLYTCLGTAINLLMTSFAAYPLSRKDFYGVKIFSIMVIVTMFFSGGMIPNFLLVKELNMINSVWALVLPGAIHTWLLIIMRTFFQQLPDSLRESATIEGANDIQILYKIVIPLSLPCFATVGLFYAVSHWNSFFAPLVYLNDKAKFPIQIFLRQIVISGEMALQNASQDNDKLIVSEALKGATIMVATLPILLVYPFIQRFFVKGVMIGAVKG